MQIEEFYKKLLSLPGKVQSSETDPGCEISRKREVFEVESVVPDYMQDLHNFQSNALPHIRD